MNAASLSSRVQPASSASRADAAFDRVWRLYQKRVARCRSENQSNRLHMAMDNYLTPDDVRRFDAALASQPYDVPGRSWIAQVVGLMPLKKERPVEFERRSFGKSVSLYTTDAAPAREKTLIVGFTGHFHRLMAPTAHLLDCLNPEKYDVIALRDFARAYFGFGIPGLGSDYLESLSNLSRVADPGAYRNVITFGTSGGGMPGLLAALVLRAGRGVAFGASSFQQVVERMHLLGVASDQVATLVASRPLPFPELILAYGAGYPRDARCAQAIQALLPTRLHPVEGCAIHSLVGWHLRRGMLPSFLATMFGQDLESGAPLTSAPAEPGAVRVAGTQ